MPVTRIRMKKQHSKPWGEKKKVSEKKKRKIFLRMMEEDKWSIAHKRDTEQGQPPNFTARWCNLLEHFLPELWLIFIRLSSCQSAFFPKFGLFLKNQWALRALCLQDTVFSYTWLSLAGTYNWDIARQPVLEGEVQLLCIIKSCKENWLLHSRSYKGLALFHKSVLIILMPSALKFVKQLCIMWHRWLCPVVIEST